MVGVFVVKISAKLMSLPLTEPYGVTQLDYFHT